MPGICFCVIRPLPQQFIEAFESLRDDKAFGSSFHNVQQLFRVCHAADGGTACVTLFTFFRNFFKNRLIGDFIDGF